jgi:Ribbon-helix-helix protein, copG family
VKSVRLDTDLAARLRKAAQVAGVSESEFIRCAIIERSDSILGQRPDLRLADVLGSVSGGGGRARQSGKRFTEVLKRRSQTA